LGYFILDKLGISASLILYVLTGLAMQIGYVCGAALRQFALVYQGQGSLSVQSSPR
jgi:hypothetical protein